MMPTVSAAPRNANRLTDENPSSPVTSPSFTATAAPNEAPVDTPSVNGVASGFRNTA